MVPAVTATGVEKLTDCQPDADSLVKVALASRWPVELQRAADVGAGVGRALEEARPGDEAVRDGGEAEPQLDAEASVPRRGRAGLRGVGGRKVLGSEYAARAGDAEAAGDDGAEVRAVIHCSDLDRLASGPVLHIGERPGRGPGRGVPGGATVGGVLDARHDASTDVGRGAGDDDLGSVRLR